VQAQEGFGALAKQLETMSPITNLPRIDNAHNFRVLTLTPFYPTDRDEANGCFISEPLNLLAKMGIRNTVLAFQPFYRARVHPSSWAAAADWLNYFSLPGGVGLSTAGAFVFARVVGRVRDIVRSQQIDLIHAHGPLPCGHAAMLLSGELNIPFVVSVHGLDAFSTLQVRGRPGEWCRRISQKVYSSSTRVICISEHVREAVLEGMGRRCRTSVVYNGVDPELFSPASAASSDPATILSVGNLIPIKGHEHLIRAVGSLAGEFPSLELEIIGEGAERGHLEELVGELHLELRVRCRGRQSRAQVADAMKRCTIFALLSRYEGLGCVYLEAMATGKPTIGCRGQGIAEIIQHGSNGFLVGPDNEKELSLALAMLLREKARREALGSSARNTILDRFTLAHQAENLVRIYRECA
jgi:glycosyltransferase involved in cell wall biosynthesis